MTGHFSKTASKLSDFHLPGLQDKKVAITAGASGIGFSIARLLHTQGVKIAICDVDGDWCADILEGTAYPYLKGINTFNE